MSSIMDSFILDFEKMFGKIPGYESKKTDQPKKRKDYCYRCENDKLYPHAMTFKCSKCHKIILGGV